MKRILWAWLLLLAAAAPAQAQSDAWDRLFPRVRYFEPLIADPMEPRMALGMLQTDVFERAGEARELRPQFSFPDPEDSSSDVQVLAGIGGTIPLWQVADWGEQGGIVANAQLGVFARFRIEYPTREDTGQDWFVGMPIELRFNDFSSRFRIMHRSSHLGDELIEITRARRLEFGGEYADFMVAQNFMESIRLYGGATWNFRSYTKYLPALVLRDREDKFQLQAGIDTRTYPWAGGRLGLTAGLDWQSQQRTNWRSQFAATGGLDIKTPRGGSQLLLRYFHGPSTMGQFFLTPESFAALEWVVVF